MRTKIGILSIVLCGFYHAVIGTTVCDTKLLAGYGQSAPNTGGGTLNSQASLNPTAVNASGKIAFNSAVSGSDRNQGVFVADANGVISAIAIGCGGSGGGGDTTSSCGDVSPVGGHFGGFYGGSDFAPDIDNAGDVLFFGDVNGGSARRGLFLYRAVTGQIVKVAVVGDPSPLGGIFGAVGPGTLNNNGRIVFLAAAGGNSTSDIFQWRNGVVTKVAAIGDSAPGGGTYTALGTQSLTFVDGTDIPVGPVPDINDSNQIAFVAASTIKSGIVLRTGQTDRWDIKLGDLTPVSGRYISMQAPSLNNAGQISFFADYQTGRTFNSGIFAGAQGNWRKVIVFYDAIDGGQCLGLAFSRNPMQSIDASGNVIFWTDLSNNGTQDRLVLGLTTGDYLIVARRGDPTPLGGTYGSINPWPSINGTIGTLNVSIPDAPSGPTDGHMTFNQCAQ